MCIDDQSSGTMENVLLISQPQGRQDIVGPIEYENGELDYVINLACPVSPLNYQKDAIHTTLTCVAGTHNLLQLANKHHSVFLQSSTSEVYVDPLVSPHPESYRGNVNPNGIRSCNDEGKRCAESLCMEMQL